MLRILARARLGCASRKPFRKVDCQHAAAAACVSMDQCPDLVRLKQGSVVHRRFSCNRTVERSLSNKVDCLGKVNED